MPNWVYNIVTIEGDKETLERIKKDLHTCDKSYIDYVRAKLENRKPRSTYDTDNRLKEELERLTAAPDSAFENVFDFNAIVPMPEDSDTFIRYGGVAPYEKKDNWYEWCWANWGTKWNASDAGLEYEDGGHLRYAFNTAWSAPEPVIRALSGKYKVRVVDDFYDEDFGHNCGRLVAKNGECVFYDHEGDYDWLADTFGEGTMDAFEMELDENGKWVRN